ncbi:hypothetical protein [Deinococcus peraridilitoris]|uniref:Uncharacterized protein n=1 Tax=Deinococcus peraridilitoris (strain DSM 19664 / LMG 22246 / CIP 109416 / KR-200) TaxID=937777 RepID=K9ZZF4_DEIPD|nr:hypothetical protein [Deinococcus peraridilitoris]AFZ67028.1 hypothetical protein Deipe_1487 [Deinococcus peraridilitoris DSM 19664]
MSKKITVKFMISQPIPERDSKGKPKPGPRLDTDAMIASVQEQLTPMIHKKWPGVEVVVVESKTIDVRVDGQWPMKTSEVRAHVNSCIDLLMEDFDAEPFLTLP